MPRLTLHKFDGEHEEPDGDWEESPAPPTQFVVLPDGMLVKLLVNSAVGHSQIVCSEASCQNCKAFEEDWDDSYSRLPTHAQAVVISTLLLHGVPYPGVER